MEKGLFDLADTALKIGLGTLISGTFAFLGARYTHRNEMKKYLIEHKIRLIEETYLNADKYFNAWLSVTTKIAGITKHMKHDIKDVKFTEEQLEELHKRDQALVKSWVEKRAVRRTLRMLKARHAEKAFDKCMKLENEIRGKVMFDHDYPNFIFIDSYRKKAMKAQEDFHDKLADLYDIHN